MQTQKLKQDCEHCKLNPKHKPPIFEMLDVTLDKETMRRLKWMAKREHVSPDCEACNILMSAINARARCPDPA